MKKNIMIIGVAGVVLLGGALGVGAFSENTQGKESELISMKKAEEIAVNEVGGVVESIELEKDDGRLKYEIDLRDQKGNDDNDVDIDARTGEIIKVDRDDDDDRNLRTEDASTQNTNVSRDDNKSTDTSLQSNTKSANAQSIKQKMTKEEAIAITLKETPGKVIEVEYDDGEYEIEIRTDTHEVDYEIDARTGGILEKDMDDLDD